ncbi:hypothetical protein L7F22_044032 [Adiantum nelumboides]|nr:hypothetical protein [Adiantum nelumboides]
MQSPPPAPKASQRAYRLSNDERRRQDISQIARKLTFDDPEDNEKRHSIRHTRNACHQKDDRSDRDDDSRPMNTIRFDGTYTFMDDVPESSAGKQPPTFTPNKPSLASKMLRSPVQIHPDHYSRPQSSGSNSDTLQSSSSTVHDSPFSVKDDANFSRKRARSIGEDDQDCRQDVPLLDTQNFRNIQASHPIDDFKHKQSNQSIHGAHNSTIQHTLEDPFDSYTKSSSNTPFIVQLQRTATHTGTKESIQQSVPFIKQSHLIKQIQNHDSSSSMQRSISSSSYLVRTPNEFREAQSSKLVVAPRIKYNIAARSIHNPKQSRLHDRSAFNLNTPSLCAPFSQSNSPSPVISNSTLPNIFPPQQMDYFGSWSAASSPLTQAH